MGFFTGFAPTSKSSIFSSHVTMSLSTSYSPQPMEVLYQSRTQNQNRSLLDDTERAAAQNHSARKAVVPQEEKREIEEFNPRRLVIVVTPTSTRISFQSNDSEVSEILRKTGIMYRHVVFKENFTDAHSEMDHQRNLALNHIEHHRLSGIVHFAGLSNIYDLSFFEEIRGIEAFGAWPIAKLSANRKSSILWDPERWGRTSSAQDTSQNSVKYVREEVLEEETKLKGIPGQGCSKVLLWDLPIPHKM
ncbi:UNVERIFIED_CONTAM: Beta-1,4-xylosyltransferase IRX9 [Sesamum calycinum]|uniref:Glycosyltransferases n=1 Tax=Sesamum calycinum TaxID=2727403 RepID=A0AAW2MYS9_9LAMI